MSKKEDNPDGFVTRAECVKEMREFKEEIGTVKKALVGEDMRGGLVKDVAEIKLATSWVKTILLPIIISVASAGTVYLVLNGA